MSIAVQEDVSSPPVLPVPAPVTIPVKLVQDAPNSFHLEVLPEHAYLSIREEFNDILTWTLEVPDDLFAYFDTPAITFVGQQPGACLVFKDGKKVQYQWTNIEEVLRGQSFYYTLHVVVNRDGMLTPVNLDPTVHNDPPT